MGIYGKRETLFESYQKIFAVNIPNIVKIWKMHQKTQSI